MTASIELSHVSVNGVDTHARAATVRQWFTMRKSMVAPHITILDDVSFTARAGDRIAVIGKNGSGKSSLLKVISGNYPIHSGARKVEGAVVPLIEMGAGFQPEISGRANIKLSYAYRGKLRHYSKEEEDKIIEFSELGEKINLPLKTYSSGMSSRLAFSSAIFQDPEILLLDEIFAAGDAGFIEKSRNFLKQKIDNVSIAILVGHGQDQFMDVCNRFVLMDQGKVINEGKREDIIRQYTTEILHMQPPQSPQQQSTPVAKSEVMA